MYVINCKREKNQYFDWIPTKVRMNGFTICELKGGEQSDFWSNSEKTYLEIKSRWLGKTYTKIVGVPNEKCDLYINVGLSGVCVEVR